MKLFSALVAAAALWSQISSALPTDNAPPEPIIQHKSGDEYVVLLANNPENQATVDDILRRIELSPEHEDVIQIFKNSAFTGFVARMSEHCVGLLNNMTDVSSMDLNVEVTSHASARLDAPWGLERISSSQSVQGNTATLDFAYAYQDSSLGRGVDIYVVDTGVQASHDAFSGRATMGFSVTGSMVDGDGHGTHVAGTAAGIVIGVGSNANIIGVKVLRDDGSGTTSDTVRGIDWAIKNHDLRKNDPDFVGSILSLSLGLKLRNAVLEDAIVAAIRSGIHVSLAAGNLGKNACNFSPAAIGGIGGPAIAIGSVGPTNVISEFSNRGACVDVYAPGENVISAWIGPENNLIHMLDGTSMACPHVTGIMAYYMVQYPELAADPAAMKAFLTKTARPGVVSGLSYDGDAKLLASNGMNGLTRRQQTRDASAPTVTVVRRDDSIFGRVRRTVSNLATRLVVGSGSDAVSATKTGGTIKFELVGDESTLRY